MRKWGLVITFVYALIVVGLLTPLFLRLAGGPYDSLSALLSDVFRAYESAVYWVPTGAILLGEAALIFISVDTAQKRLKPRGHVGVSVVIGAMLAMMLSILFVLSIGYAARGDIAWGNLLNTTWECLLLVIGIWLAWGIIFYLFLRGTSAPVTRVVSWLLKGSVLELLVVVPCHVIVRRRQDCCAPIMTSFGIVTGVAVMLLSFGPSVLLLYKKRLDEYRPPAVSNG